MATVPPENTRVPREAHQLDEAALGRWLAANVPGATPEITLRQFRGGQSNPTYWVGTGDLALVLRKKPPGKLLPSAHAVEREYRIMRALASTDVPVPDALALCEDANVVGTPFFVMRYVPAKIYWDPTLPELPSNEARRAVYREYVRALAALHRVDYVAVGLADYGKVGQYVARQVERWSKQYEASRTGDVPSMERLMKWLPANIPSGEGGDETTLIHGDWRLDNMMFSDAQECVAVLDWELSTLGHPASDVAYAAMGYHLNMPGRGGLAGVDVGALGIPTESELVAEYCALTNRDRIEGWSYFMAFGMFRLAAIAQGVYKRSLQGNASSDDAGMYGAAVTILSDLACSLAHV
jgi:aminoglycoside phosphotransferase (APT) family kinase protein